MNPRTLSRSARLLLAGGLSAGAAFAAVTGTASATSASPPSTAAKSTPAPPALPGTAALAGPPGAGPGGTGTITAINGSELTLRTINGNETVDVSSSTTYTKEMRTIDFSQLAVGDVVQVAGTPLGTAISSSTSSSSTSSPSAPPAPGTGRVHAQSITVEEPTFTGRVLSDRSGEIVLVGPDGQLLTVSTTSATRYYRATSSATASIVSAGSHVTAEGTRTSLTHLDAAVITSAPTPPAPGHAPTPPGSLPSKGSSSTGSSSS